MYRCTLIPIVLWFALLYCNSWCIVSNVLWLECCAILFCVLAHIIPLDPTYCFLFKMFEVWQEITQELEQEYVRPVSPDRDCLAEINRLFEERTANVFSSQKELIQNQTQHDLVEEQACYAKVNIFKIL